MPRLFSIKPAITFKGRSFLGLRGWSGKPTHPPLTDFPIVAYVLAATFDIISFIESKGSHAGAARDTFVAATYVIVAGGVMSLATALTGFMDWWKGLERHPQSGPPNHGPIAPVLLHVPHNDLHPSSPTIWAHDPQMLGPDRWGPREILVTKGAVSGPCSSSPQRTQQGARAAPGSGARSAGARSRPER